MTLITDTASPPSAANTMQHTEHVMGGRGSRRHAAGGCDSHRHRRHRHRRRRRQRAAPATGPDGRRNAPRGAARLPAPRGAARLRGPGGQPGSQLRGGTPAPSSAGGQPGSAALGTSPAPRTAARHPRGMLPGAPPRPCPGERGGASNRGCGLGAPGGAGTAPGEGLAVSERCPRRGWPRRQEKGFGLATEARGGRGAGPHICWALPAHLPGSVRTEVSASAPTARLARYFQAALVCGLTRFSAAFGPLYEFTMNKLDFSGHVAAALLETDFFRSDFRQTGCHPAVRTKKYDHRVHNIADILGVSASLRAGKLLAFQGRGSLFSFLRSCL